MAPNTISPVSGAMVNVMGSSSATPMAADRPGRQPMMMPMAVPPAINSKLLRDIAFTKPCPIKAKVSSITHAPLYLNSRPTGSFTPRNMVNAP